MDSNRIQPVGGNHATEVMAIGVEWGVPPLDDAQITSLRAVYEAIPAIKEFFPKLAPVQAFMIQNPLGVPESDGSVQIEPQNLIPPQFTARKGGFDLHRSDATGKLTWVASIRPEFISVSCTAYDGWKNVKPQALAILQPFLEAAIGNGVKINAIGLQYQDAFRLIDGASPEVTGQLFRKNSQYLPSHLFEEPSFGHCHQGWFSKSPNKRRVLNNAATDVVVDVNGLHFARIGGQHRMFATEFNGLTPNPISTDEIDQILECLHDENIGVINGILSDGALKAIGYTVREAS